MLFKKLVNTLDSNVANISLNLLGEKNGLSSFLFHAVNKDDKNSALLYPQERITLNLFEKFIVSLLENNYTFISPNDITNGPANPNKKYGLITFDDGYFNNTWIVDILNKYQVPATFFISTSLITENEKNWPDVIYFERHKRGATDDEIHKEVVWLSSQRIKAIKDYIAKEFGNKSFIPQGDEDRMLNQKELLTFSKNNLVHIGNHSHNHEALGNLTKQEVINELSESQQIFLDILGYEPNFISYPYGSFNDDVVNVAKSLGFTKGITTIQRKNKIPIPTKQLMTLNRLNPRAQDNLFNFNELRSPIQLKTSLKQLLK